MTHFFSIMEQGGVILWLLLVWGIYLYYLVFSTDKEIRGNAECCQQLNCIFVASCMDWQSVDVSCRNLRRDLVEEVEGKLLFLKLAVNIAPLLGLLGTVLGILKTFIGLGHSLGISTESTMAIGISEALVTTQLGLILAIPSYLMVSRISRRMLEVEHRITCFESQCRQCWQNANNTSTHVENEPELVGVSI